MTFTANFFSLTPKVASLPQEAVKLAKRNALDDSKTLKKLHAKYVSDVRASSSETASRLNWTREQVLDLQTERLRLMVEHAKKHSVYYSKTLAHVDPSTLNAADLSSLQMLPSVTKDQIMDNWDDIVTDKRLTLEDTVKHLSDLRDGKKKNYFYLNQYYPVATGGTSGKRGVFIWDWDMLTSNPNINSRWELKNDLLMGNKGGGQPKRTAVICAGSYIHASRLLFSTMIDPERDAKVFHAGMNIKEMVDGLNDYQPDRIVGYASVVEELTQWAVRGELRIEPSWVATNSEPLEESARQAAKSAWGIDIHNSWGSVEIGLAAYEGPSFGGMSLAEDFVIVETVDKNNRPVKDPRETKKILVTRLYGGTMPLIRYEMSDALVLQTKKLNECDDAPGMRRIDHIAGRSDIWFDYGGGVRVHPMVFRHVLGQDDSILEYQVQQTRDGAHILLVPRSGNADFSAVSKQLEYDLSSVGLGEHCLVTIAAVDELPRHPETNKLKRFVPLA